MREERWLDPREAAAWRALQAMQLRVNGELSRDLTAGSRLSYQDYVVLVVLTDSPDGRVRQFELADVLGWERSRLSHHLARMAARGLVSKERCAADRRGAFVVVTEEGRREIEAAAPGHVAAVRRCFIDVLSPGQLDAVRDVAEAVLSAFERRSLGGATGCDEQPAPAVRGRRVPSGGGRP
jgi:DNA-binding MarR family transcriptional regulator